MLYLPRKNDLHKMSVEVKFQLRYKLVKNRREPTGYVFVYIEKVAKPTRSVRANMALMYLSLSSPCQGDLEISYKDKENHYANNFAKLSLKKSRLFIELYSNTFLNQKRTNKAGKESATNNYF